MKKGTKGTWYLFTLFTILWTLTLPVGAQAGWVDGSVTEMLPPAVSKPLTATTEFPLFWWNFLVLESKTDTPDWSALETFCARAPDAKIIDKWNCGFDISTYQDYLKDWSADQFQRIPPPPAQGLHARLAQALAKASLPLDPKLLNVLRTDPLESYKELTQLFAAHAPLKLPRDHGFFYDATTHRAVIPVQFAFPPAKTAGAREFMRNLETPQGWEIEGLVGPHASTLENETQVYADVEWVSGISAGLLALLVLGCLALKRWRLILLAPPVLLSTAVSAALTVAIFGKIHGLTLAFGPGIVGLVLDHGLHSCFNMRWKGAWRANFYGLITTLAGLIVFLASSVPLLRQLATFSVIGLSFGFLTYRWLHRRYPQQFEVEPLPVAPKSTAVRFALGLVIIAGVIVGAIRLRPDFGMRSMNFQTAQSVALSRWTLEQLRNRSPLIQITETESSPLPILQQQMEWARANGVTLYSPARFLRPEDDQKKNLAAWAERLCISSNWTETERKFFQPFFAGFDCQNLAPRALESKVVPAYLQAFAANGKWLTTWLLETPAQEKKIKEKYPSAVSLQEITDRFPIVLAAEVAWMAPIAILLAIAMLWHYYQNWRHVFMALVPFLTGLGLYSWVTILQPQYFSFVGLIALVMVFGFSLDYGIFSVNLYTGRFGPSPQGVWTSVLLAAVVTLIGFGPLILCSHPVLKHLGHALFWGTTGTVLGCIWGIPGLYWWFAPQKAAAL